MCCGFAQAFDSAGQCRVLLPHITNSRSHMADSVGDYGLYPLITNSRSHMAVSVGDYRLMITNSRSHMAVSVGDYCIRMFNIYCLVTVVSRTISSGCLLFISCGLFHNFADYSLKYIAIHWNIHFTLPSYISSKIYEAKGKTDFYNLKSSQSYKNKVQTSRNLFIISIEHKCWACQIQIRRNTNDRFTAVVKPNSYIRVYLYATGSSPHFYEALHSQLHCRSEPTIAGKLRSVHACPVFTLSCWKNYNLGTEISNYKSKQQLITMQYQLPSINSSLSNTQCKQEIEYQMFNNLQEHSDKHLLRWWSVIR